MVPLAIESSKYFVDRYVVVDKASKDGSVDVIRECRDRWHLDVDIYIKPELILSQARMFAVNKLDEEWILIQDGDEVFHRDGPNSVQTLRKFLRVRNVVFCAPMTQLAGDFIHTHASRQLPPHPFLYHNNDTFYLQKHGEDLPGIVAARIYLSKVYKFNCKVKSPQRIFLYQYWGEWCKTTEAYKRYENVEDYVKARLGVKDLSVHVEKWYKRYVDTLKPYDEKKYGYYPKVIREYINQGKIRGNEKNRLE